MNTSETQSDSTPLERDAWTSQEPVEIDEAVSVAGSVITMDFRAIGPRGHVSERRPNLFQPGESGNRYGRYVTLSKAYRKKLAELNPDTGRVRAEDIADNIVGMASTRNRLAIQAASELADRTEGKSRQTTEINVNISLADRIRRGRERIGRVIEVEPMAIAASSQD